MSTMTMTNTEAYHQHMNYWPEEPHFVKQKESEHPTTTTVYDESAMEQTYDQLAERLKKKASEISSSRQYWVAISGGPGSGKSTIAQEVATRLNNSSANTEDCCVVLPMDGFHYSKNSLKEMNPPEGEDLLQRRGAPWTMDAENCNDRLHQAKEDRFGELPTFDRRLSDPVPGGVKLMPHHKIVLVEGLYLLWKEDERWEELMDLWDEGWFVRCASRDEQRNRLIQRSLQNWNQDRANVFGHGKEGAKNKVDQNDAKNMDLVASSEEFADVLVISKNHRS